MTEHRNQFRIAVDGRALLKQDGNTILCHISALTEQGLQIRSDFPAATGDTIQLECQLEAHTIIHCALLVTHVSPPHVGGRITEISPEHHQQLMRFLQQLIAQNLEGMQREMS
jgi:PilZ domain-containing protein